VKPLGPIPQGFGDKGGVLAIGAHDVEKLVELGGGTPLFVYSRQMLVDRVASLRAVLPAAVRVHYAIKANPYAPLLQVMSELVDGFDVASGGELQKLLELQIAPGRVSFAGPGKRDAELTAAIAAGVTINLESEGEAERALRLAEAAGVTPRLAIRVNPDFDLKGSGMKMGGGAKPFGVDAERVPALARRVVAAGAQWRGFHIFAGSQAISADAIIETQAQTLALASRLAGESGLPLPHLNLGGGF